MTKDGQTTPTANIKLGGYRLINVGDAITAGDALIYGGALGTPTSGVATNITGLSLTTGVTGTLPATNGGTGQTTYTTGDIVYASSSTALSKLGIGTNNYVLTSNGTTPVWAPNPDDFRNRLINGDMRIDQRNAGASGTANGYTVDRWAYNGTQAGKGTWGQNLNAVTPPVGFKNYLGFQSSSAYAVLAADIFTFYQPIEGVNIQDLLWGTANAKAVTLQLQVYSSLTGNFGGVVKNGGGTRSYPFLYTIPVANTWTTITVTIPGDTSGTWATDTSIGLFVQFGLGVGSTNSGAAGAWAGVNYSSATGAVSVVGTNAATWYITGLQFEIGSVATPFERRFYAVELSLCYRYFQRFNYTSYFNGSNGQAFVATCWSSSDATVANIPLMGTMRSTPSITCSNTTLRFVASSGIIYPTISAISALSTGPMVVSCAISGASTGAVGWFDGVGNISVSAEL